MITRTVPAWQAELAAAIHDPMELLRHLGISMDALHPSLVVPNRFTTRVPLGFVGRMRPGDPHDPLLRQVLPLGEEGLDVPGYLPDPLQEKGAMATPGVLHKYRGRVLLVTTGACAIHCRYCFRRHFPYAEGHAAHGHWNLALEHIAADISVQEVILSGGDPLSLGDDKLAALAERLSAIPHLRRLRLHTRMPVVLPSRVEDHLSAWLRACPLDTVIVLHANHPNELDGQVRQAVQRLTGAGVTLLNQSVLLRGVNDSKEALIGLSEGLFAMGVLPYYLHQLDPVAGASHFAVPPERARALLHALRAELPGYLVPRLVREQPGLPYKLPLEEPI